MEKSTFSILGIMAVLLLSLGLTSAYTENGFEIEIAGAGSTIDNRISGNSGDVVTFSVNFTNTNATYPTVDLILSGVDITPAQYSITGDDVLTISFTIPTTQATNSRTLNAVVNSSGETVGEISDLVYYTVNSVSVYGCTNSSATNYNPAATVDDGSCTYAVDEDTLCELEGYDEDGNLEISDFDVSNNGEGKDDEWQYLDNIEIVVEIENTANDDIEDVEVKIVILDNKIENGGNDVTNNFDMDEEVLTDIGKLKDGDQESVTFLIEELPADIESGTYYIYLMAYEDGNEEEQCISEISNGDFYFAFSVEPVDYEDSIVARGKELEEQINTYCGQQNLEITIPIYNLGEDDEEKILVNLYNAELGIDEYAVIDDLGNGDRDTVTFLIDIPSQLDKERYDLDIIISFDWDDDEDEEDPLAYSEEVSDTSIRLDILGCKAATPSITANLESSTEIGKDLIVRATITNNGASGDFVIAPTSYESWANLISVTPGRTTIASGESQEVLITLSPKEAGSQTFKISVVSGGETYNQPVSVKIAEEPGMFSGLGLSGISLYLVIGIVVLLVLILLVLIVKLARRPARSSQF